MQPQPPGDRLRFDGRVALISGAGAGLGRSYASLLAARGAAVVVNDVGTGTDGTGTSHPVAQAVVDGISRAGGIAVANRDTVATADGADAMVEAAIASFGRLDIVINNAGFLRDATIAKASPESVDAVLGVHLKGALNVARSAWPHLAGQRFGRIVNTTSAAGLLGNFGQSGYAAAKMGVVGLTRVLALEGARKGILVNAVAPFAHTRLTDSMVRGYGLDLDPDLVAPAVAWLAHDDCRLTGEIISAGGGQFARFFVALTTGWRDPDPTPESVAAHITEVCDPTEYSILDSAVEQVLMFRRGTAHHEGDKETALCSVRRGRGVVAMTANPDEHGHVSASIEAGHILPPDP